MISYLNISDIRIEDGGGYSCKADNGVSTTVHYARINVIGAPIVRPMKNVTIVAGESLVVKCPAGGYPIDTIAWERGNNYLFIQEHSPE